MPITVRLPGSTCVRPLREEIHVRVLNDPCRYTKGLCGVG